MPMDSDNTTKTQSLGGAVGAFFWDLFKVFIISGIIILPVRYYVAQPFIVSGSSMEPNFHGGEYLIINEITYKSGNEPQRGDVVVFKFPKDETQFYIKRIVGLPGETVQIVNGSVRIFNSQHPKGEVLKESYLPANTVTLASDVKTKLGKDEFYALGDNRNNSSDSRFWGALPKKDIVGKVLIRAYPFQNFAKFSDTKYSF